MRRRHGLALLGIWVVSGFALGCHQMPSTDEVPAPPAAKEGPKPLVRTEIPDAIDPPKPAVTIPDAVVQRTAAAEPPKTEAIQPTPPPPAVVTLRAPDDPPIIVAMRELLLDHPELARKALKNIEGIDEEFLNKLLEVAAQMSDKERLNTKEGDQYKALKNELAKILKARLPLTLGKVCFCLDAKGFGHVEAWPDMPAYHAGVNGQCGEPIRLYFEVMNFANARFKGDYNTTLSATVLIFKQNDPRGNPVFRRDLKSHMGASSSPRQDYFKVLDIPLPANLGPGLYTLRLDVRDETEATSEGPFASRFDSRSLDFRVIQYTPGP